MFLIIGEVPRSGNGVAAITRRPHATFVRVQTRSDVLDVARDVNGQLYGDEYPSWAIPYLGEDEEALARFRASPGAENIPDEIMGWPIEPWYIPFVLRAPGIDYS
ncbi:hypothetical protein [Nocardiopsis lucentensis]|uniref:hypothetical protein n=1 Tax=Nocardiopsis lucentensis TaxID=53441 RepID=UPI0003455E72|nr:hypothetical protein [Nocardiopsis lucentensis]